MPKHKTGKDPLVWLFANKKRSGIFSQVTPETGTKPHFPEAEPSVNASLRE